MKTTLTELDSLVRQGLHGEAREILFKLNFKKIPRDLAADFADVARRVNTPGLMLQILEPIVDRQLPRAMPATVRESALYGTALSRLGLFQRAQKILSQLEASENPEVLLFQAQNFQLQWDALSAMVKFSKYLSRQDLLPYARLVGEVNLASCYLGEMQWDKGDQLLAKIRKQILSEEKNESYNLLNANCLGLQCESAFLQGQSQSALALVNEASNLLVGSHSRYELMVKKWLVVLNLFENPQDPKSQGEFFHLKKEAIKVGDAEIIRDFDFYQALAVRDDSLFLKLYHGTQHASYRKRIVKIYQPTATISRWVVWEFNREQSPAKENLRIFDLSKGCEEGGKAVLTKHPTLFRLMQILTRDFYRPIALGTLFDLLYQDEHYDPFSSPNRVYLVVKRLRAWFKAQKIPLDIEMNDEKFRLVSHGPYGIRFSSQEVKVTRQHAILESLANVFSNRFFSAKEASSELNVSLISMQRTLAWGVQNKKMTKRTAKKTTLYRFKGEN